MKDSILFVNAADGEPVPESGRKKDCMVFGAGFAGMNYFAIINERYHVLAYVDNDPDLWGETVMSLPVISPEEMRRRAEDEDFDIVICVFYAHEEILRQLEQFHLRANILRMKAIEFVLGDDASLIDEAMCQKKMDESRRKYLARKKEGPIRIVFIIHMLQLFSSNESIYEEMLADDRFEPIIVLTPRYSIQGANQFYSYDSHLETHMKKRGYEYRLAYQDGEWIDLYSLFPDGIFYQVPYTFPSLPSIYREYHYADHIKIIHTPYGVLPTNTPDTLLNDQSGGYRQFLESCWRLFLDKPNYDAFINDPRLAPQIVLSGSPKVDFYARGIKGADAYFKGDGSRKILYTPTWMAKKGRSSFLKYAKYFLNLLQNESIELAVRPHPLLLPELEASGLIPKEELDEILSAFREHARCVFDLYGDYRSAILSSDFAVMDVTSLTYEYLPTEKPLILCMQEADRFGVKKFIRDAAYVAYSEAQLDEYVSMLLAGEDPKMGERTEIVRGLESLFPNGGSNAAFIKEYIAEWIRR